VNPIPDPTPGKIPPVVIDQSGLIVPVDDADEIKNPPPVETLVQPMGQGSGVVGGDLSGQISGSGGGIAEETIPPPNTYTYREVEPAVTHKVIPAYPDIAKLAAMDGNVIVRVFVGTDGRVKRAEIEKGNDLFNDAALEAVRQWRFTPALNNNQPVGVWVRIPIHFQING
jgi:protein TonB